MNVNLRYRVIRALCTLAAPIAFAAPAAAAPVSLTAPTATFCQDDYPITEAFDGSLNPSDGWAIYPNVGSNFTAVVKAGNVDEGPAGTLLRLNLYMLWGEQHTLGNFRLSVTNSAPSTFGQGSTCSDATPDGGATWTVLTPTFLGSQNGQTLTVQGNGSILASGTSPPTDVFTYEAVTSLRGITGFRIEALANSAFPPNNGPGRSPGNGNFVLTEMTVDATALLGVPALDPAALALVALLLAGSGALWLRSRRV